MRYNSATKPIYVGAFKPDHKEISYFQEKGLISDSLMEVFERYELLSHNEN